MSHSLVFLLFRVYYILTIRIYLVQKVISYIFFKDIANFTSSFYIIKICEQLHVCMYVIIVGKVSVQIFIEYTADYSFNLNFTDAMRRRSQIASISFNS